MFATLEIPDWQVIAFFYSCIAGLVAAVVFLYKALLKAKRDK